MTSAQTRIGYTIIGSTIAKTTFGGRTTLHQQKHSSLLCQRCSGRQHLRLIHLAQPHHKSQHLQHTTSETSDEPFKVQIESSDSIGDSVDESGNDDKQDDIDPRSVPRL